MANVKISALPAATIFRLASQVPESEGTSTTYKSTGAQILSTFLQSLQYDVMLSPYAATTANLTATYDNGIAGVGATLTNSGAQAAFATDGVSPPINSLIFVWQQSSGLQNGPYLLTTVGTGATNWVLTRPTWWDASDEINQYQVFSVLNGTLYANETFQYIGISSPTVGTTALPFSLFQLVLPSDIQNMTFSSGVTSGTGSAYTVDISPTPDGLQNFQLFEIQFHTGNSDSPTININGFGAIDLINNDGESLPANAISSSGYIGLVAVTNSGTSLTLLNPAAPPPIVTPAQIQNQAFIYGTDDGGVDAFHASFTPAIVSYVTGQRFSIAVADANTGACTFEAESLTPKPIVMADGSTPPAGAIVADSIMDIEYTASSNFQLMNPFVTSTGLTLLRAQLSGDQGGIAPSTTVDIAFDTAPINIGGMLNTTTYEWTADATGNYIHSVAVAGHQVTDAPALSIVSNLNGIVANAGFGNSVTLGTTYFNGGILPITIPAVAGEVFKVQIENIDAVNPITVNGGQPSTFWTIITDNGGCSPSLTYPIVSQKVAVDTTAFAYTTANDQTLIFDSIEGTSPIDDIYNTTTGTITIPSGQQFIWQFQLQGLADTANISNVRFAILTPFSGDFNFTQPVAVTGGVQVANSFTGAIQAGATVQVLFDASGSGNWVNGASFAQGNTTYLQITRLGPT